MKKAFLLMALLCVSTLFFAQTTTQTAMLKHGDNISVYYGLDAFVEANAVAQNGDIITLSSGTFNPSTITKAITLRGAGCVSDAELMSFPTTITGRVYATIPELENALTIEGVYFETEFAVPEHGSLLSPTFIRCNFGGVSGGYESIMNHALFINCRIKSFFSLHIENTTFNNCVIWESYRQPGYGSGGDVLPVINVYNSFMVMVGTHDNLFAYNSIISSGGTHVNNNSQQDAHSMAYNCIGILNEESIFGCPNFNCWDYNNYADVFESFTGEDYDWTTEPLILKGSIAAHCLGDDGTQVGIYGGTMPYNARPTYMTPYRSTVDHQSTPDGKLKVNIEVINEGK